jgi:predicted Zn-dependent peptidase
MDFYKRYYVPANMVVSVVGDVKAAEVVPLAEKYLGRLPAAPKPAPVRTEEPKQVAERQVVLRDRAQPFYAEAYHKPSVLDADDAVYDVIGELMSRGRTSRLYRSLVRDKRIAANAAGFSGFPGEKYPNLFVFFGVPLPGHTPDEVRDAIRAEIERLKNEDVSDQELQMVKTRAKADLVRRVGDNSGLAFQLGTAQARFGDWRELFRHVERIEKVTKEDVRRVAGAIFTPANRTVGVLESTQMATVKGGR